MFDSIRYQHHGAHGPFRFNYLLAAAIPAQVSYSCQNLVLNSALTCCYIARMSNNAQLVDFLGVPNTSRVPETTGLFPGMNVPSRS